VPEKPALGFFIPDSIHAGSVKNHICSTATIQFVLVPCAQRGSTTFGCAGEALPMRHNRLYMAGGDASDAGAPLISSRERTQSPHRCRQGTTVLHGSEAALRPVMQRLDMNRPACRSTEPIACICARTRLIDCLAHVDILTQVCTNCTAFVSCPHSQRLQHEYSTAPVLKTDAASTRHFDDATDEAARLHSSLQLIILSFHHASGCPAYASTVCVQFCFQVRGLKTARNQPDDASGQHSPTVACEPD
jgi:hypothetical protein